MQWLLRCLSIYELEHIWFGLSVDAYLSCFLVCWVLLLLTLRRYLTTSSVGYGTYTVRTTYFILLLLLSGLVLYSFASGWQSHIFADVNGIGF